MDQISSKSFPESTSTYGVHPSEFIFGTVVITIFSRYFMVGDYTILLKMPSK